MQKKDYLDLYNLTVEELIEKAYKVTKKHFNMGVEFCSIISAKTGACPEDCKYCAQSVKSHAEINVQAMMNPSDIEKAAKDAKEKGASHFGIVISGKTPSNADFEKLLEAVRRVSAIKGMECCCSAGILDENQMKALKDAGCVRYNHNINTSEQFYDKICTTHSFKDRIKTAELAKKCGIGNCTGVIIGMGETREDRIDMALTLKKLNPESVPINILDPIKGTALENCTDKIDEDEIIKTICIFRIIMPDAILRYGGGRHVRLRKNYQKLGMMAGINGLIIGNYLTTLGCKPEDDFEMIETLGMHKI
ncbi:MAG: biotin synthase BioB [Candidatus Gastranaerophilales bacterium]|nr:biotin synthase BioB [Candidatus Gastranaerophilales bacterium]